MNEKTRFMLALIAPAALVLLCFQVVPILTGANASFRDWTLYDPKKTWVGLANYIHVLRDAEFLQIVLPNTFGFMVATVALSLVLGLMIALVLNKRFAGRWLVQSFVLLPLMVAPVIAAIMIRWMFNDQFGVVNAVLEGLGFAPISWLTQRWTAFLVILLTDVWLWTPWFALILLAGLQSLPPEPFEAAQIDAAGAWRTFRYITLPMLRPVMVVCVVIRAIDAFRTFDIVWTISGGGPARVVIACDEPTSHDSPPLGEVTVTAGVGGGGSVTVKTASLASNTVLLSTLVTFTFARVVADPLTVQE
jgi:multiple sugar transport system permease protein